MSSSDKCTQCNAKLCQLDKALHRKLVSRGATTFMCKKCLAEHFGLTEQYLDELADRCRRDGCTLFV